MAHRVSFSVFKGEIPPGLCVLHRCDTPMCVNPDHLFLGTQSDNMLDMYAKNRGAATRRRESGLGGVGVTRRKNGRWQAQFSFNSTTKYVGCFATRDEAIAASASAIAKALSQPGDVRG